MCVDAPGSARVGSNTVAENVSKRRLFLRSSCVGQTAIYMLCRFSERPLPIENVQCPSPLRARRGAEAPDRRSRQIAAGDATQTQLCLRRLSRGRQAETLRPWWGGVGAKPRDLALGQGRVQP